MCSISSIRDSANFLCFTSRYDQNLAERESKQKMEKIDDEIHLAKEKSRTDAEYYKVSVTVSQWCGSVLIVSGSGYGSWLDPGQ